MSKYTITIRNLVKNNFDFGLQDYPIFDSDYRSVLNDKIIKHYYMNEIGLETPSLFKFFLNQKMHEIMPYYNELYKNQKKLIDKMVDNTNLSESYRRNVNNTSTTSGTASSNSRTKSVYQDTPQGSIKNSNIDNFEYASDINLGSGETSSLDSSNSNGNSVENYVRNLTGNSGSKYNVELMNDLKNGLLNIDMMIINELEELFMGVF